MRSKPDMIRNSCEDKLDEPKRARKEGFLLKALQPFDGEEGCKHTPDTLNLIDTQYHDGGVISSADAENALKNSLRCQK
ncbi:MAG: hypothetical protein JRL30_19580 [Deltaproteobacteria bacterium]|nr:hypothetical protein [Deltaproteobacteria bacterium]